eukprot:TRINITY_DN13917_c0_g1_i1.p1 TRINITY_DN13917_c0_g1~~TRINITY_DN13917_c0_g1_i1.p1  ORF type:complete len:232 (-),score=72.77 TRINITY_DN13917_c0_g1_i1:59-754(-)
MLARISSISSKAHLKPNNSITSRRWASNKGDLLEQRYKVDGYDKMSFPTKSFDKYRLEGGNASNKAFHYFVVGSSSAGLATIGKNTVNGMLGTMNASSDVVALANIEVDLNTIPEGVTTTVKWRGKPLFVRHRTAQEIEEAVKDDNSPLPDPQKDADRVKKPEWLVVLGICTHLGCVPLNNQGDYAGWFCPCHGSHYDTSGRIRKGPAPLNLEVPPYSYIAEDKILVGVDA